MLPYASLSVKKNVRIAIEKLCQSRVCRPKDLETSFHKGFG